MFQLLSTFFVISLTGALSPGPLSTAAIAEGSRRGKWAGWWLSVGHGLVEGAYVLVIALLLWWGQESILNQPLVAGLIALVGGIFLAWMGWNLTISAWRYQLTLGGTDTQEIRVGLIPTGIIFSISNPYWWIWWALIATLYIRQAMGWGIIGVLLLYLVHWLADIGWLTGLAWLTGSGRALISPGGYRWIMLGCGVILFLFGLSFVGAGIKFLSEGIIL
jgi:threonine/homoserine/homoserine lactone efflux protein